MNRFVWWVENEQKQSKLNAEPGKKNRRCVSLVGTFLLLAIGLWSCVDPVEPSFRFRENFVFVDGELSNLPGFSRLRLQSSRLEGDFFRLEPLLASSVESVDEQNNVVQWQAQGESGLYTPPADFAGEVGRSYHLRVLLENGTELMSNPERMPSPVPIERLQMKFAQEAYYSDALRRFVPAFRFLVDFEDPAEQPNYYRFRYQTWEKLDVCLTCNFGRVNPAIMACISNDNTPYPRRFDYPCLGECWENTLSTAINVFSDQFVDGNPVIGYEAARIPWDWYGGLLVIVEQQQLSEPAFAYNEVIQEISLGSSGLNASLPAALTGNVFNTSERSSETVLGYFAAVASTSERIYFNRDTVEGTSLPLDINFNFDEPPAPGVIYMHPCDAPNRSSVRPEGWPN